MINTFDFDGTYLTVTSRGSLVGTTFYRDGKFSITGSCYAFKLKDNNADKYNLKFLFYFLRNNIKKYGNYSGPIPQLHIKDINKINILVPPLKIQNQIAEILDEFEETNSNLNKSLNENIVLTDKQFNLYQKGIINILLDKRNRERERERERDELIILINYWMQNALYENQEFLVSDLFEIKSGNSKYSKEYILENPGDYPVYSGAIENDGEFGKIDTYDYDGEFLTWTTAGYGGHVFYRNGQFSITGACGLLSIKHNYRHQVNLKFFKFILNNITKEYVTFIKQNYYSLKSSAIAKIPIILPPIHIQNKIVEFLSNLDENNNLLINSMDNEIELRKKQFGIYQKSIIDVLLDKRERERERERRINHSD
ncbi:type I site-specific DNA methyltransferase specificity subunit [Mesomycoplasma bovoculi M165/69]|uniref:Type I site-specific DNA methyltransferase specificity subunit n=2 Tax=Mesomycoplasma bovoculi TaxID=45362 RepID=W5UTQ9_9BACT|nr:type I site-specific DNA methyltransferase specificity subunit [Mesomycoplasma bovoculi M165/69]